MSAFCGGVWSLKTYPGTDIKCFSRFDLTLCSSLPAHESKQCSISHWTAFQRIILLMHRHNWTMHWKSKLCRHSMLIANTYISRTSAECNVNVSITVFWSLVCVDPRFTFLSDGSDPAVSQWLTLRIAACPVAAVSRLYQEITHSPAFLFRFTFFFTCRIVPHCDGLAVTVTLGRLSTD